MSKIITIFLCSVFFFIGCVKEKEKALVYITVTSSQGFPQPNSFVNFYVNSKNIKKNAIDTTLKTDKFGNCVFCQYHECYLDVLALKIADDSSHTAAGSIEVRLIPGETLSRTIVVK